MQAQRDPSPSPSPCPPMPSWAVIKAIGCRLLLYLEETLLPLGLSASSPLVAMQCSNGMGRPPSPLSPSAFSPQALPLQALPPQPPPLTLRILFLSKRFLFAPLCRTCTSLSSFAPAQQSVRNVQPPRSRSNDRDLGGRRDD